MIVGVPLESEDGERRVALVPSFVPVLAKSGFEVLVQKSAGQRAGFLDVAYEQAGRETGNGRKGTLRLGRCSSKSREQLDPS